MADDTKQLDYIRERVDTVADRVADVKQSVEGLRASFESHVEQDERMRVDMAHMSNTLDLNTRSLQEHMRRTDLLETMWDQMNTRFSPLEMEMLRKKAVANWVSVKLKFIAKLGAAVSAGGAIGVALSKLVELFIAN